MSAYYFDSSALVKYYAQEIGTAWVSSLINARPANEIIIALATGAETVAAITRRKNTHTISTAEAARAIAAFKIQFRNQFKAVRVTDTLVNDAMLLAEKHGLRGYDAIQLASTLFVEAKMTARGVGPLTLIAADNELNQAAQAEGLLTDDPNQHP